MELKIERCCACDEPTGKAGAGDGSLYTDYGIGPFCVRCYDGARCVENMLHITISSLSSFFAAANAQLTEKNHELRLIAGALGEFYGAKEEGKTVLEKIKFLRDLLAEKEARLAVVQEAFDTMQILKEGVSSANEELRGQLCKAREAVEWAIRFADADDEMKYFKDELRRRAGGEGK